MGPMCHRRTIAALCYLFWLATPTRAEPPVASYLFPAGGQRGATVNVLAGGLFLNKSCNFEIVGPGVSGPAVVRRAKAPVFEGPVLPLPESQRQEDYPQAMAAEIKIAADAPAGSRFVRMWTSQGATLPLAFVVGDLPEIVEQEIEGDPVPVLTSPPVTVNGRVYPREDEDLWSVRLKKSETLIGALAASTLGSPLDPRLEIFDAHGRKLAESRDGLKLVFTAPADGDYSVKVTDVRGDGGPAFVYRLTLTTGPAVEQFFPLGGRRGSKVRIKLAGKDVPADPVEIAIPANAPSSYTSNGVRLDVDDLPETIESVEPADPVRANFLAAPAVGNGRIASPAEVDRWTFAAKAGESFEIDLRAHRLGSPLLGVLSIQDAAGKPLGQAEPGPAGDPSLKFTAPANGTYSVTVRDRFRTRGGPSFAYRLRVNRPLPGFDLQFAAASLTIPRGQQVPLKLTAARHGNLNGPIHLKVEGLPAGVTAPKEVVIAAGQAAIDIPLKADPTAKVQSFTARVIGTAYQPLLPFTAFPVPVTRTAAWRSGDGVLDNVRVAVAMPTPFKIAGEYLLQLIPRGTVYPRHYRVERNGFAGPIEVTMADRQARHLQGVTGGAVVVPPDKNEFDYAIELPPWMETGRTCRVCIMGTATVKDADGSEHVVTFSSVQQNEQIIAVVEPERLALRPERDTARVEPGTTAEIDVTLGRGEGLGGPASVRVIVPSHFKGVEAVPFEIAAGATRGKIRIRFAADAKGPFNAPLVVRAVVKDKGLPVAAEAKIELVAGP